jgi:hypothetical protein
LLFRNKAHAKTQREPSLCGRNAFAVEIGLARFARLLRLFKDHTPMASSFCTLFASLRAILFVSSSPVAPHLRVSIFRWPRNAEKPPLFSDGYRPGAIRELGEMYTGTVTVSRKCS